jgi:hypothetical protein
MLDHQDDIDTMIKRVRIAKFILSTTPISSRQVKFIVGFVFLH